MKFVVIFGPQAVGKMTVGLELAKITKLKLLHNHMTIDLVRHFFEWESPQFSLSNEFRTRIFEEVAGSDLEGLIFTFVWLLTDPKDKAYIDSACDIFRNNGAQICFVELFAEFSERQIRNESELRLAKKTAKRDLEHSRKNLIDWHEKYKMNSTGDFFYPDEHLFIDNSDKAPADVAREIKAAFDL